jgi:LPS sulfotransferase NodH
LGIRVEEIEMNKDTVLVMGCTRSGLSLMMQMIHASGYPCKGEPPAFEVYPMMEIPWEDIGGFAVKVVDADAQLPPAGHRAKIIRMTRDFKEQAKSIQKFTCFLTGIRIAACTEELVESLRVSYAKIDRYLKMESAKVLEVPFEKLVQHPMHSARRIDAFLHGDASVKRVQEMKEVVRPRDPGCYPGILEMEFFMKGE